MSCRRPSDSYSELIGNEKAGPAGPPPLVISGMPLAGIPEGVCCSFTQGTYSPNQVRETEVRGLRFETQGLGASEEGSWKWEPGALGGGFREKVSAFHLRQDSVSL